MTTQTLQFVLFTFCAVGFTILTLANHYLDGRWMIIELRRWQQGFVKALVNVLVAIGLLGLAGGWILVFLGSQFFGAVAFLAGAILLRIIVPRQRSF